MAKKEKALITKIRAGLLKGKQIITGKKPEPAPEPGVPVVITSYSQPHVLRRRMEEGNMTHDQKVIANLNRVRVEPNFGKMILYFCPMDSIDIINQVNGGDGGSLPEEAIVEGLELPTSLKHGLYNLRGVELHSNGTLSVKATSQTKWEVIETVG